LVPGYNAVTSTVGTLMEIERKFVLDEAPEVIRRSGGQPIRQGYVAVDDQVEVRLREAGAAFSLTVKVGRGLARAEHEIELTQDQFASLWSAASGRQLEKVRFRVDVPGGVAEIDVYGGDLEGMVTAEVEFESLEAARAFAPPRWFGVEVTDDERYANRNLALHGAPGG
jgi:CYTH domain-containing protein